MDTRSQESRRLCDRRVDESRFLNGRSTSIQHENGSSYNFLSFSSSVFRGRVRSTEWSVKNLNPPRTAHESPRSHGRVLRRSDDADTAQAPLAIARSAIPRSGLPTVPTTRHWCRLHRYGWHLSRPQTPGKFVAVQRVFNVDTHLPSILTSVTCPRINAAPSRNRRPCRRPSGRSCKPGERSRSRARSGQSSSPSHRAVAANLIPGRRLRARRSASCS